MKVENLEDLYELSPVQLGMLFHNLSAPESGVYVVQLSCTLQGDVNVAAFERAWQWVLNSEPALRTSFMWEDLDKPIQLVHRRVKVPIHYYDWHQLSPDVQEEHLAAYLAADRKRGFVLTEVPLMRLTLIQLEDNIYRFIWSHHHLLLDGWSVSLIIKKVLSLYETFCHNHDMPLQYGRSYKEHIAWLQRQDFSQSEEYWRKTLKDFTPPVLFVDQQASSLTDEQGDYGEEVLRLSAATTMALLSLAKRSHLTMNTLLMGAWAVLLSRYSGEDEIVFGTTVSGRPETVADIESMVGLFINTVPMRVRVLPYMPYTSWATDLQNLQSEISQYAYSSLTQIRQWSDIPQRFPLFTSIFIFESYPSVSPAPQINGSIAISDVHSMAKTHYSLCLLAKLESELGVWLQYDAQRFERATIERMLAQLRTLLEAIAANPQECISLLPLLTEAELHQQLLDWNATQATHAVDRSICEIFESQVEQTPAAIAVYCDGLGLTYRELNQRANQLAHYLRRQGVGSEVLVGIYMERSLEMVVGLLGILKAGGAYVPLDPAYPKDRLAFMLNDAQVTVLLTQERLKQHFSEQGMQVFCVDSEWELLAQMSDKNLGRTTTAANLAYVMYTSGSTGKPKGTMISHQGLANYLLWCIQTYQVANGQGAPIHSSISFDLTVTSLFAPLLTGCMVYLLPEKLCLDDLLSTLVNGPNFSFVKVTPSHLTLLHQQLLSQNEAINARALIIGGENLLAEHIAFLQNTTQAPCIFNEYGPTETVVGACVYQVSSEGHESGSIPIGRPIANTQIYLLDRYLQPLPIGVPGEIYIGGAGVARGYLNQPMLSAERFIPHPFSTESGARLYKTGDLARYLPDGNMVFLGRIDQQVKVRGFRVELGEIEAVLSQYPGIQEVCVLARDNVSLVAYLVMDQEAAPSLSELKNVAKERLPAYMVPGIFALLDTLPRTANGKIDQQALLALDVTYQIEREEVFVAPRNVVEEIVADIWVQVLPIKQVGIYDNFFEVGGHSLLAMQVMSRLQKTFQMQLPLRDFLERATIAELSHFLIQNETKPGQTEKIAQVHKQIKGMSSQEIAEAVQRKRQEKGVK